MSHIDVDPVYGVNPTMPLCFWCGQETGDILLVGLRSRRLFGTQEAPRHCIADKEPCRACKKFQEDGYITIRLLPVRPPHGASLQWHVEHLDPRVIRLKAEVFAEVFCGQEVEQALKIGFTFMETLAFQQSGLEAAYQQQQKEKDEANEQKPEE